MLLLQRWSDQVNPPRSLHVEEKRDLGLLGVEALSYSCRRFYKKEVFENLKITQGASVMSHLVLHQDEEAFALGDHIYCLSNHPIKSHCTLCTPFMLN